MSVEVFASLEFVDTAAVRALCRTAARYIEVHLGMAVPEFHVGQGARTMETSLVVQGFGKDFDNR
jgi:hypothetical protein